MAYQNVGTPRFYVNTIEWLASNGVMQIDDIFRTLPVDMSNSTILEEEDGFRTFSTKSFIALLGHTITPPTENYFSLQDGDATKMPLANIVNLGLQVVDSPNEYQPGHDGFTIATFDSEFEGAIVSTAHNTNIGSIIIGSYYDMPHSPDLSLSLSYEYGGIKEITTKGGSTLTNAYYTKPSPWGDAGAWELYSGTPANQKLSRSGKRVFDLSFSYLSDSDLFPKVNSIHPYENTSPGGDVYSEGDVWFNRQSLLDSGTISTLIHKTNGGQLPFIFQPDGDGDTPGSGNNNPDQFAICKFDMKSFSFQQTAPGLYSVKMKIREVW